MDSHFHAYQAKYDIMDDHVRRITQSQYIHSIDIFINLDDVFHNMHRPLVEKEVQLCGIDAKRQLTSKIINLIAHYKQWGIGRQRIKTRVFAIYTKGTQFKNAIYVPFYRDHFLTINDPSNASFKFVNDALRAAVPIAHNICDYVEDVFMVDSQYLEPSIIPMYLKECGVASYDWSMIVSRDPYDLQYAYLDKWLFVSPKGDNTMMVHRKNLWDYVATREHVREVYPNQPMFHHDLYPLALSVAGNKLRGIPRLRRVGWKTIFKYLNEITEEDTESIQVISSRFIDLMTNRGTTLQQIDDNLRVSTVRRQISVMTDIDRAFLMDQLKYVTDHEALQTINDMYFGRWPLNIPFLINSINKFGR